MMRVFLDALPSFESQLFPIIMTAADLSAPFPDGLPPKDAIIFQSKRVNSAVLASDRDWDLCRFADV